MRMMKKRPAAKTKARTMRVRGMTSPTRVMKRAMKVMTAKTIAMGSRVMRTKTITGTGEHKAGKKVGGKSNEKNKSNEKSNHKEEKSDKPKAIRIDLEGIEQRVVAFPVPDGRYGQIMGIPNKALFTSFPIQGQLDG